MPVILKQIFAKIRVNGADVTFIVTMDKPVEIEEYPKIDIDVESDDPIVHHPELRESDPNAPVHILSFTDD